MNAFNTIADAISFVISLASIGMLVYLARIVSWRGTRKERQERQRQIEDWNYEAARSRYLAARQSEVTAQIEHDIALKRRVTQDMSRAREPYVNMCYHNPSVDTPFSTDEGSA